MSKSYIKSAIDIQNEINQEIKNSNRKIFNLKIILLGNVAVGKTAIIRRFIEDDYSSEYFCTLGIDFRIKSMIIDDRVAVDLKVWDTCGEEKYRTITRQYYRDAAGILLVFDLNCMDSFEKLKDWMKDIKLYAPKNIQIVLLGNKNDLPEREVNQNMIDKFLKDHKGISYLETSALSGYGVDEAFKTVSINVIKSLEVLKKKEILKKNTPDFVSANIVLSADNNSKTINQIRKSKCC